MSDLPAKHGGSHLETDHHQDDLVIDTADEMALREARERMTSRLRAVWNGRRFLFRVGFYGLLIATAVAFLIPKSYQSTTRLMPPDQSSGMGGAMLAALSSQAGSDLASLAESALGLQTTGALFVGILKSNHVRDDLIKKFDLMKVYHVRYLVDARKVLAAHTEISEDENSGIVSIQVTDHSPQRAAEMAQEYVNELDYIVTHLTTSSAYRESVFLHQRLLQVKSNLETAEKDFSQFASKNTAIDIPEQGKAMVTAAATLQGQLIASEAELRALRQIYTENNVRVRSLQAQVSELRQQLEQIGGKNANENSSAGELYPSIRELPLLGVRYADLLRRVKVEDAVFVTLTQEYELAKVQAARDVPLVQVLDLPLVPRKKSFPPHMLIMFLGTLFAVMCGVGWLLGNASWQAINLEDPRKALAIEVWGDIRAGVPWGSQNGHGRSRFRRSLSWIRKRGRRAGEAEPSETDKQD